MSRTRRTVATGTIHHLAEVEHWAGALVAGEYRRSTLGRSLEEEGFVHCSTAAQVGGVLRRHYSGHDADLVLLTLDPARLEAPVRWEGADPDTGEPFPHVYGPIPTDAVVATELHHPPFGGEG